MAVSKQTKLIVFRVFKGRPCWATKNAPPIREPSFFDVAGHVLAYTQIPQLIGYLDKVVVMKLI